MRNWFRKDGLSKIEREIVTNVDKHGCHITGVFDPDGNEPPFAYSIGFTKTLEKVGFDNHPEVILFGLPGEVYGPAINQLLAMCAAGFELKEGERIGSFFGEYDGIVRMVHESQITEEYFTTAMWFHRTQMDSELSKVAMLFWPDSNGIFPWENGCEDWVRADQPALYEPRLNS